MSRRAFTLVEVLVGTAVLVGGGGALLAGMNAAIIHTTYLNQMQTAMYAAEGKLAELSTVDFETLATGVAYVNARRPSPPNPMVLPTGLCAGLGEDLNCNGILEFAPTNEDVDGDNVLNEPSFGGRLTIQIQPADPAHPLQPNLLNLHVAACWRSSGRVIGEDKNLNGRLDAGEDANGSGWMDSPVMISTLIARDS